MELVEGGENLGKKNMMETCYIGRLGGDQIVGISHYFPVKHAVALSMICSKFHELM